MFYKNYDFQEVKGANKVKMSCDECKNETEHFLVYVPHGLVIGLPFLKKPWLSSNKSYGLACSLCGKPSYKISKEQAQSLINK